MSPFHTWPPHAGHPSHLQGADPWIADLRQRMPIHYASMKGHASCVTALLQHSSTATPPPGLVAAAQGRSLARSSDIPITSHMTPSASARTLAVPASPTLASVNLGTSPGGPGSASSGPPHTMASSLATSAAAAAAAAVQMGSSHLSGRFSHPVPVSAAAAGTAGLPGPGGAATGIHRGTSPSHLAMSPSAGGSAAGTGPTYMPPLRQVMSSGLLCSGTPPTASALLPPCGTSSRGSLDLASGSSPALAALAASAGAGGYPGGSAAVSGVVYGAMQAMGMVPGAGPYSSSGGPSPSPYHQQHQQQHPQQYPGLRHVGSSGLLVRGGSSDMFPLGLPSMDAAGPEGISMSGDYSAQKLLMTHSGLGPTSAPGATGAGAGAVSGNLGFGPVSSCGLDGPVADTGSGPGALHPHNSMPLALPGSPVGSPSATGTHPTLMPPSPSMLQQLLLQQAAALGVPGSGSGLALQRFIAQQQQQGGAGHAAAGHTQGFPFGSSPQQYHHQAVSMQRSVSNAAIATSMGGASGAAATAVTAGSGTLPSNLPSRTATPGPRTSANGLASMPSAGSAVLNALAGSAAGAGGPGAGAGGSAGQGAELSLVGSGTTSTDTGGQPSIRWVLLCGSGESHGSALVYRDMPRPDVYTPKYIML